MLNEFTNMDCKLQCHFTELGIQLRKEKKKVQQKKFFFQVHNTCIMNIIRTSDYGLWNEQA